MGKRASQTPAASPAAKRQSVASPAKPSPGRIAASKVPAPLEEVFKILKASSEKCTASMLIDALPLAMKPGEEGTQRHDFQEKMLDAAAKELSNALVGQQERVRTIEEESAQLEEDKGRSAAIEAEIAASLAEKKKDCDAAEETLNGRNQALKEAKDALEAAKKSVAAAEGERHEMEKTRDEFVAGLEELWTPLKAAEFPGKLWRDRDRKLSQLVQKFQAIGVEESLLAAIQTALKMKEEVRAEFAQATVAHAGDVYTKHIEAQKDKIEAFGAEVSTRATAVSEGEAVVKDAQETADARLQEHFDAQNAWAEVTTKDCDHRAKMAAYEPTAETLQKNLATAQSKLLHMEGVSGDFTAVRSGKPTAAEAAAAAAAQAAAAEAAAAEEAAKAAAAATAISADAPAEQPVAAAAEDAA